MQSINQSINIRLVTGKINPADTAAIEELCTRVANTLCSV